MAQQYDLSGLPDNDEKEYDLSGIPDLDLSGLPDGPSVVSEPKGFLQSAWEWLKNPKTTIGSDVAAAINSKIPDSPFSPYAGSVTRGAIELLGGGIDAMTSPINAGAMLATGGASALGSNVLKNAARAFSAGSSLEGMEMMKKAESIPEYGLGALQTVGGMLGVKQPTPKAIKAAETAPVATNVAAKASQPKLNYSVTNAKKAEQILGENGIDLGGMSSNQMIELAEQIQPGYQGVKATTKTATNAPKPKGKMNSDGTFSPEDYPDIKLDINDGKVVGTHSGKPIPKLGPELEHQLANDLWNYPRGVMASLDLSFPFRQGLGLIHKPAWWKSWGPMVKSFGSEKAYDATMAAIREKPLFRPQAQFVNGKMVLDKAGNPVLKKSFAEEMGLAITDTLSVREHEYMNAMSDKFPGVKASNRAYTAFANKLRADTFQQFADDFAKAGIDITKNEEAARALAAFVNNASGRGNLGSLEKSAQTLNNLFFSPRLMASRINTMGGAAHGAGSIAFNPKILAMKTPDARKEYLKSMMAIATAWGTMASMAKAAGAEVVTDPTNSDFGKIKIGDTRLDPMGGFQQFIVLANRMAQGKRTSSTTGRVSNFADAKGPYDPTHASTLVDFISSKAHPSAKYIYDWLDAQNNDRGRFDVADRTARMTLPIIAQDLLEIMNEGSAEELATLPFEMVGMGAQTYGTGDFDRKIVPEGVTGPLEKYRYRPQVNSNFRNR